MTYLAVLGNFWNQQFPRLGAIRLGEIFMRRHLLLGVLIATSPGWVGCSGGSSRLEAPTWDPPGMAEQAMSELDADGDGKLSMEELEAAPGLKYCAKLLDEQGDRDGSLNLEEITARLSDYEEGRVGLVPFDCTISLGQRPLVGAKVRLVPESFVGDVVQMQESTSGQGGRASFAAEGISMSVVPPGMYRVEVTSTQVDIPEKYNTKTTLGVEISSMTDPYHQGPVEFRLTK